MCYLFNSKQSEHITHRKMKLPWVPKTLICKSFSNSNNDLSTSLRTLDKKHSSCFQRHLFEQQYQLVYELGKDVGIVPGPTEQRVPAFIRDFHKGVNLPLFSVNATFFSFLGHAWPMRRITLETFLFFTYYYLFQHEIHGCKLANFLHSLWGEGYRHAFEWPRKSKKFNHITGKKNIYRLINGKPKLVANDRIRAWTFSSHSSMVVPRYIANIIIYDMRQWLRRWARKPAVPLLSKLNGKTQNI